MVDLREFIKLVCSCAICHTCASVEISYGMQKKCCCTGSFLFLTLLLNYANSNVTVVLNSGYFRYIHTYTHTHTHPHIHTQHYMLTQVGRSQPGANLDLPKTLRSSCINQDILIHLFQLRLLQTRMMHDPCFIASGALLQQVQ